MFLNLQEFKGVNLDENQELISSASVQVISNKALKPVFISWYFLPIKTSTSSKVVEMEVRS